MGQLLALAAASLTISAADPDLSKLPPPSPKTGLTYVKDIRPLLEASCFNCHGEKRQKAELRLDSLEAALKGSENGKVIKPGKSKDSLLVVAIAQLDEESAMPPKKKGPGGPGGPGGGKRAEGARPAAPGGPGGPGGAGAGGPGPGGPGGRPAPKPLTAEEVGLVRAWIDQGAK